MFRKKIWSLFFFCADLWNTELFFYLFSVEHVVYAEWYYSVIWGHVVDDAVVCPFHIESVGVHECHAPNQQQSSPDVAKRIIRRVSVYLNQSLHRIQKTRFSLYFSPVQRLE